MVEQKILEAISISLERLEEPQGMGVCLEEVIKRPRRHSILRHGLGLNPLEPTLGAETQGDTTVPPFISWLKS